MVVYAAQSVVVYAAQSSAHHPWGPTLCLTARPLSCLIPVLYFKNYMFTLPRSNNGYTFKNTY